MRLYSCSKLRIRAIPALGAAGAPAGGQAAVGSGCRVPSAPGATDAAAPGATCEEGSVVGMTNATAQRVAELGPKSIKKARRQFYYFLSLFCFYFF